MRLIRSIRDELPVARVSSTSAGWTTSVTGLAMATASPNKAKGSWTHSRSGPIVNTPRRLVGNAMVNEALVSESIRSHRIRRPTSVANAMRGGDGLVGVASLEVPVPVVRWSVETQRREVGATRMRQLHQEAAGSTDGYQRRGDHHVDLDAGGTRSPCENHDGGDHQGEGDSRQHEKEGRISRAERNGEQDDGDECDRGASPCRSQAGRFPHGVGLRVREVQGGRA